MKPTERYAAVALLLLVALVIVVGFWDTGEPDRTPLDGELLASSGAARMEESARPPSQGTQPRGGAQRAPGQAVPLSGASAAAPTVGKVTTRRMASADHRVTPGAGGDQGRPSAPTVRVEKHTKVAQSADQLSDALKPGKRRGGSSFDLSLEDVGGESRADKAASRRFLSVSQPKATTDPVVNPRADRMAAATSIEVANTRKKEAAELKKAVSDPTLQTYKVKSGDALIRIAKRECGSDQAVAEIVRLNGLVDSDIIFAGMVLKLPSRTSVQAKVASASSPRGANVAATTPTATGTGGDVAGRRKIRIKSGEVLGSVLERELGTYVRSIALVRELNPGLNPEFVQVGQQIVLPARSEVPKARGSKKPSRGVPAPAKGAVDAPRLASNTASRPGNGRNSNTKFYVR